MSTVAARLEARRTDTDGSVKADNATVASGNHAAAAAFLTSFEQRRREAESDMSKLSSDKERGSLTDNGAAALSGIASSLASLAQDTSKHAHLLPAYDLRATKTALANMDEALAATKAALQPRKKFAFKKKTAASGAAAAAAAASSSEAATSAPVAAMAPDLPPEDAAAGFYRQQGRVLIKSGGSCTGVDVTLSQLTDCVVFILDMPLALRCHALVNCHVYCAPVAGSVLIYGARSCSVHVAARQLRIHEAHGTSFHLHALSGPIIEHSDDTAFDGYDFSFPMRGSLLAAAGLAGKHSMHQRVEDFNWLRTQQSPNWRLIDPAAADPLARKPVALTQEQVSTLFQHNNMRDDAPVDQTLQSSLQQLVAQLEITHSLPATA